VESVADVLMLENSAYWLAPAVVGLGAWSGDDPGLCGQAIAAAYKLAPARTALLLALILRRQGRQPSSVLWLRHYLRNLDPTALSREFAVVLEAGAQGAFGSAGRALIHETVDRRLAVLADDAAAHEAQVKRWRFEVERHVPGGAADAFPRLVAHSPQWPDLEDVLRGAETHQPFIDRYSALLNAEFQPSERIEDSIDDILDILVTEYDDEELPLRRELAGQKAVIEHEGDIDAARESVEVGSAALGDTLDYLTIQTSAALDPAAIGVTPATQQVALASCVEWAERAHAAFTMDYRQRYPVDVQVHFQEQQPIGSTVFTLPDWTGSLSQTPIADLQRNFSDHWDAASGPLLESLRFNTGKEMAKPLVFAFIALIVGVAINPAFGVLAGLAIAGIGYLGMSGRRRKAEAFRQLVADTIKGLKLKALEDLRGASAEYTDYQSRARTADAKEPMVRSLIGSFADLGRGRAPYEGRTLLDERYGA
jgi:hypothetical protein